MLPNTHENIAELIISQFTEDDKRLVSRSDFKNASKAPDFELRYLTLKHTFEGSFNEVETLIEDILSKKQNRTELGYKLGVISHFISDYCCSYHSNPEFNQRNIVSHVRYEFLLSKLEISPKLLIENSFHTTIDTIKEDLMVFIKNNYESDEADIHTDLKNAVSLTKYIFDLILYEYKKTYEFEKIDYDHKPRIAIFSDTYYPHYNGVSNTLYQYMQFLDYHKIPFIILTPKYKTSIPDKEAGFGFYKSSSFPLPFNKGLRLAKPNKTKLNKILDDFEPEVIHCFTEWSMGRYGLQYAKNRNIKVISNYTTHFDYYLRQYHLPFLERFLWNYMRSFHNQADITLCPSNDAKEVLLDKGFRNVGIFGRGISNEFNTIKRSTLLRNKWNVENKTVLLYCGRISLEKRIDILMESYKQLKLKYKDSIALVIIGDGPLLPSLQKEQLSDVIYTGFLNGKELYEAYASCDIFAFPSPFETLGNVVLEAMASGLPVVGVNKGGVKENIIHDTNGFLAQVNDSNSFASYLDILISDQHTYSRLKKNALLYCKQKSWISIFKNLIYIFRQQKYETRQ